jgi:nucleotide-binding universal stress UspA family protein
MTIPSLKNLVRGRLTVAVGFDEQTSSLVDTAVSFARKFDYQLRFVNVIEGAEFDPMSIDMPGFYSVPPIVRFSDERLQAERQNQMRLLLEGLDPEVRAAGHILHGDGPRVLIADAVSSNSSAIMTACNVDSYHLMPSGFSMALTLMHEAPMPVFVVSRDAKLDFASDDFRILVADDLLDSNRETIRKAYELACAVKNAHLRHVHVHGDFREVMRDTWMDITEKNSFLKTNGETPDSLWAKEYNLRLEKMKKQGQPFSGAAEENGVDINYDVRTGNVAEEVHSVVEEFKPNLIFYGRHKFWRARPFLIGRMPFRSMLQEKKPIVMVPARDDMYAVIALP